MRATTLFVLGLFTLPAGAEAQQPVLSATEPQCAALFEGQRQRLHSSESVDLCALTSGKTVLLVNTASHCGFTPQFRGLEALHREFSDEGLVVIGYPSNDFNQEASEEAKTAEVCYANYGVSFTMLTPGSVTGPDADPIFQAVAGQSSAPSWNFNKYLISQDGAVLSHWASQVRPDSEEVRESISRELGRTAG